MNVKDVTHKWRISFTNVRQVVYFIVNNLDHLSSFHINQSSKQIQVWRTQQMYARNGKLLNLLIVTSSHYHLRWLHGVFGFQLLVPCLLSA